MKKLIFEHLVNIPDWDESMELLNKDCSYEECYWKRLAFPKIFYDVNEDTKQFADETIYDSEGKLISISISDSHKLKNMVILDLKRRTRGVHIKIADKIEWISPDYYFFIQWFQHKDLEDKKDGNERLGSFRLIQNDVLSLWEHVKWDENIAGLILPKIKKFGMTYLFCAALLNEGLTNKNWDIMMMSKDFDTCKNSIFSFIKYGFDNLPWILKADVHTEHKSELSFGRPKKKPRWGYKANHEYLNVKFTACKTKVAAFDGPVPKRCWDDEFPKKWVASKVSVKETHDKSLEAIKVNQFIRGKLLYTSYMPETNDQGFLEAKLICEQSLLKTIKPGNKRTESGMIIFPIYAYHSNQECFDKFGRCDEKKARTIVEKEYSSKITPSDKQSFKRQYPLCWNDMFGAGGKGATFPNFKLSIQKDKLTDSDRSGVLPYKEGNLYWENSIWETGMRPVGKFCNVYFKELSIEEIENGVKGSIKLYHDLDLLPLQQIINKVVRDNIGKYDPEENFKHMPDENNLGVVSVDPVDYKLKSDVREGSLNAAFAGFIYDSNLDSLCKKIISNTVLFEYNFRHEDPDKILEDMIKLVIMTGFYVVIEANKGWVFTEFKKHGLEYFLLVRQSDGSITPYQDYEENKPIGTDSKMIDVYCRSINRYFADPKEGGIDYVEQFKSIDTIDQLLNFDPMNTRKYDLTVSLGYWRVGVEAFTIWRTHYQQSRNSSNFSMQQKEYNVALLKSIIK